MTEYQSIENLGHDPKLAEELGNMIVAWAHAELMILSTFARVTGVGLNMAMESYYCIPTFESRTRFTLGLLGEWNTSKYDRDAIRIALNKLAKLARTRNQWVHGDWCTNPDETETVIFNHRAAADSPARRKPVKAADVRNHCEAVILRADDLGDLIRWRTLKG